MVYSAMRSSGLQSGCGMAAVKPEFEDHLEEEHGPLNKRSKFSHLIQGSGDTSCFSTAAAAAAAAALPNPLDEPSPLGLRLKKSPSLLELFQMRLSQGSSPKARGSSKKEQKGGAGSSSSAEKLKASNFTASILRIGTWEYKSRYEGDLVAKCYFAKHKLVWEVLNSGLKYKIEIQWSDIMGLRANYPEDGPGTLDVVLARQPHFYMENNPLPRKHTLWHTTSDFTDGQASMHRRHFLECPPGFLGKHFEKLIQCDPRLNFLSHQGDIALESPCFEPRISVFDDPCENRLAYDFHSDGSPFINLNDAASPSGPQSSSSRNEHDMGRSTDSIRHETPSPSSVMNAHVIEEIKNCGEQWKELGNWEQIKVPGLHTSMFMSDLVSHLENRISEQKTSNNVVLSNEDKEGLEILDEISRDLFSDSQYAPASDENSLMTRVNSLCCLLQRGESLADLSAMDNKVEGNLAPVYSSGSKAEEKPSTAEVELEGVSEWKQTPTISRKDSVGELLLNLPRIASLPQFLLNISEDVDNQARLPVAM